MDLAAAAVAIAAFVWLVAAVPLALTDLRTGRLPTRLIWATTTAVAVIYTAAALIASEPAALLSAAGGAITCGAILLAVHLVHPPSLGLGDVRLSVLNGLLCGWWGWQYALAALFAGFVLAVPEAVVVLARHGSGTSRPIGPYLLAGTTLVVLWATIPSGLVPAR